MKNKQDFYKELPIGLAMSLGMSEFAMEFYSELDNDTKNKIDTTIKNLEKHDLRFLE